MRTPTFTRADPRPAHRPDPAHPTATHNGGDGTATRPATTDPVPLTPPVDKSNWLYCNCCRQRKPPENRAGWRCGDCAARAAKVPKSFVTRKPPNVA